MEFVSYFMKKYFLDKRHGILDKGKPPSHFDEHGNFSHVKNTDISIDAELDSFYGNATGTFYLTWYVFLVP